MKFSIVIPTHNRAEQLIMTLTAFNLQSFDHDQFEVIVVDDGSDDQTREAIDQFQASYRLLYISTGKKGGRSYARNQGIAKSKGQFIIFCDADFIVIPTFLKILEKYHTKHPDSVVSGIPNSWNMVFTQYYPQFTLEQRSLLYHTLYDKGLWKNEYWGDESQIKTLLTPKQLTEDFNKIEDFIFQEKVDERTIKEYEETTYAPWLLFVTRCVSVKRRNLDKVGWFDERFKKYGLEDWELGYRLHLEGVSFVSMRERVGYHQEHPKAQSEADGNNENLKYMFEKFGFSDPELNLFSFCPAYDNIALYKDHLRSLDKLKKKGKKKKYKNMNQEWKSLAKEFYYQ